MGNDYVSEYVRYGIDRRFNILICYILILFSLVSVVSSKEWVGTGVLDIRSLCLGFFCFFSPELLVSFSQTVYYCCGTLE
jgi:hypothetical protein